MFGLTLARMRMMKSIPRWECNGCFYRLNQETAAEDNAPPPAATKLPTPAIVFDISEREQAHQRLRHTRPSQLYPPLGKDDAMDGVVPRDLPYGDLVSPEMRELLWLEQHGAFNRKDKPLTAKERKMMIKDPDVSVEDLNRILEADRLIKKANRAGVEARKKKAPPPVTFEDEWFKEKS
jgi:hypothetical protein